MSNGFKIPAGLEDQVKDMFGSGSNVPSSGSDIDQDQLSALLENKSISDDVMRKFVNNPEAMMSMGKSIQHNIDPNMLEKAKKMAGGAAGNKIRESLAKQNISPSALRKMHKNSNVDALIAKQLNRSKTSIVIITAGRMIKDKQLISANIEAGLQTIFKDNFEIEEFPELSIDYLEGKTIFLAYKECKTINKRVKRIINKDVGGEVVFFLKEGDLKSKDIEFLEKNLEKISARREKLKEEKESEFDSLLENI